MKARVWRQDLCRQGALGKCHEVSLYAFPPLRYHSLQSNCSQGESAASSRRSSGRAQPSTGAASRAAPQKRSLAQTRRAVRPATPEDEDGEEEEHEGEEEEEEDEEETSSVVDDDREARLKKSGLAKEVHTFP